MTPLATVLRLHELLVGKGSQNVASDATVETEEAILTFIYKRWGAINLARLPEKVSNEIVKRPSDFLKRAIAEANQPF